MARNLDRVAGIAQARQGVSAPINRKNVRFVDGGGLTWTLVDDPLNDEVEVSAAAGGGSGVPTGTILDFAANLLPSGWVACDGAAYGRTGGDPVPMVALFAVIGTTWGPGDGSTTFNVPNLNRRTRVGKGGAATGTLGNVIGNVGGAETHTLSIAELATHSHGDNGHIHNTVDSNPGFFNQLGAGSPGVTPRPTWESRDGGNPVGFQTAFGYASISNNGGGSAHNNMQPSAVVLTMIKM